MTDLCILIADNDPASVSIYAEFLRDAGYQVLGAASLSEARQVLETRRIHLAILDLRLTKDEDQKDKSGLTLAKEITSSIPKLILTKFPIVQDVREALRPDSDRRSHAVDYVDKRNGLEELLMAIERAIAKHVRINWSLHIRWDERERLSFPHLVTLIEPHLDTARLPDRAGELEDLVRKLFYERSQIIIGRLLWHREGRVCVMVFAHSPKGASEQLLVTCGLRLQIEQEIARHKEFAPKGGTGTALAGSAETMHFAAIAYALPKADLEQAQTFEAFYRMNKAAQVRGVLKHLFQTTLAAWHQEGRLLEETKSLGQLYGERLSLTRDKIAPEEFQRRMQIMAREALSLGPTALELSPAELILRFPNSNTVSYPNPIPHLYDEAGSGQPVICRITPGTLSGDNILVDQKGQTWLTDFAQAGPGPLLGDFVSLEAVIRFDLVDSADLQAVHEFERRLVTPSRLNERLDTQDIDPQFRKALGVIQEIRRLAFHSAGGNPLPYYEGLLFRAMSDVAGYVSDLKHTRRELARLAHALLAAAMICHKITQMTGKLSPEDSSSAAKGVEIDEDNRQVWVEGRRVALSPSEFDVMLYLYNHAGQLCSRRSIVEKGLRGKYMGDTQETGRINTMMTRLRKKIEPDPDQPCYIITVRGEGYMLCPGGEGHS